MNAIQAVKDLPASASAVMHIPAEALEKAIATSCVRIAPCWPLKHFVAVNPYFGIADKSFLSAAEWLGQSAGSPLTLAPTEYIEAIDSGRIDDAALTAALKAANIDERTDAVVARLTVMDAELNQAPSMAGLLDETRGWAIESFLVDRISHWAMAHFDEGQADWRPDLGTSIFAAWKTFASIDKTPNIAGLKGLRPLFNALPDDPQQAIAEMATDMGLSADQLEMVFDRLLMSINGWASYARYIAWGFELKGESNDSVMQVLAIRLAWDWALWKTATAEEQHQWAVALAEAQGRENGDWLALLHAVHNAYELSWQTDLVGKLNAQKDDGGDTRPAAQAVFCIDVRSEVYRRALEAAMPGMETIGFAGFFGAAIEYVPLGAEDGALQCPVLLNPGFEIAESSGDADKNEKIIGAKRISEATRAAWYALKMGAISSFAFVETLGLGFASKLITDTLGVTRPGPNPAERGVGKDMADKLAPTLEHYHNATGIPVEERVDLAAGMLGGMTLTSNLARLVVLTGHGSTSVNNPHASGLDCGACGGHAGDSNARVSVMLLNDPEVRAGLAERGQIIPDDTIFVAGLHDTTTDEVVLFDTCGIPDSHRDELKQLKQALKTAGETTRRERAAKLNLRSDVSITEEVLARSNDWSQVRPEWGLAGCAAFIAAPRKRTQNINLDGRAFLHNYDAEADSEKAILELIMTAPMVVASWINLQYYASTVDNVTFGCGDKTLHNVVGKVGVLEGHGGDLRTGLSWQSLHDGEKLIHEPMRLNVIIEAPIDAMNKIIAGHDHVRHLLDHGWVHLFHMDGDGKVAKKYAGGGEWAEF
ncbi:YbcC family protein [Alterisphingorhabdus coralli]|uniref:Probable inorganic carbon transporter subunit DabA n=1 Tax=Alterisphingorhabdus coralli TaxID=3071408 RepID=A0AA97F6U2_9SPHN|nr:DUF2309 domain-containing protein [Parasphingorhabdus sp. SCSIO 66989]WOE75479.1 DUF2309 domain-containing protein [Parasphingorhabdus sp. SCSIO 66989]